MYRRFIICIYLYTNTYSGPKVSILPLLINYQKPKYFLTSTHHFNGFRYNQNTNN